MQRKGVMAVAQLDFKNLSRFYPSTQCCFCLKLLLTVCYTAFSILGPVLLVSKLEHLLEEPDLEMEVTQCH